MESDRNAKCRRENLNSQKNDEATKKIEGIIKSQSQNDEMAGIFINSAFLLFFFFSTTNNTRIFLSLQFYNYHFIQTQVYEFVSGTIKYINYYNNIKKPIRSH